MARRPPTPSSPSSPPRRSPGCWFPSPSGSPAGSARSTTRRSAACTTGRRRGSPGWRSSSRSRSAGWIWLPGDGESRSILLGAVGDRRGRRRSTTSSTCRPLPKLLGQIGAAMIPVLAGVRVDDLTLPFVGGFELRLARLPADRARDRRRGQRHQLHRRRRRARRRRLHDRRDHPGDRSRSRSTATRPACWRRSPPAARSASCATASRPPRASWGTPAPTCSATCSATAAVQGALKTNAVVALAFPLIVLAVPILDTGFVVAKRLKYRQPIYQADRWHFHHRMANIGFSPAPHARLPLRLDAGPGRRWRSPCASSPTATTTGTSTLLWTAVMVVCWLLALAASVYLVYVLEILKLRARRGLQSARPAEFEVDSNSRPGSSRRIRARAPTTR